MLSIFSKLFGNYSKRELKRNEALVERVLALDEEYHAMSDRELKSQTDILKKRLANGETLDDILPEAFATCREATVRVQGIKPYPVQVVCGIILHQGRIGEMKTGEGKTNMAALPAYLNALSGKGVHVVTVNDYLAKRDSEWIGKIYRYLGISVGLITHDLENHLRKEAYAADITYGTNNEFGFDYLRDNMVIHANDKVQRGHSYAIVDEVDSILIDEARTPLIISGSGEKSTPLYGLADKFARSLRPVKVAETDEKEDNDELYREFDYIINEKLKTCSLTKRGVQKAEDYFHVDNLTDPENVTLQHHINQAIKAHGTMHRDIEYVVREGQVIIVDEFTGRLMYGRRYNEGLHQAIEAKEGVEVARESKTLATITFQNYFRLYDKLSGMTGTALTEEEEFAEIYKLDVIEIPTNRPMIREDCADIVYKTEKAKFNAVINDIAETHKMGQPVLVGTISIEKSEELSAMLKRRGVKHEVLNAKYHEKEAEIIAQAGHKGAVTIATNMAGRGTDIMLGGNDEFMAKSEMRRRGFDEEMINEAVGVGDTDDEEILEARKVFAELRAKFKKQIEPSAEEVKNCGGLYIIGTERHESRRIDNQLRGRAGRQGDPGKSRFYISLEDDLMRLFGGDRIQSLMDRFKIEDDVPIEANMVSNSLENAQRKKESNNFAIRKNVLQYDDVMNVQRETIYAQRDKVLNNEDMKTQVLKMVEESITYNVNRFMPEAVEPENWDMLALKDSYNGWLVGEKELVYTAEEIQLLDPQEIAADLREKAVALYEKREKEFTPQIMREVERVVLLKNVDREWMDHIDAMDELKNGIRLRAYGQHDPVVEYRNEGFDMFEAMIASIREMTAKMILTVKISSEAPKREKIAKETGASGGGSGEPEKKQPVKKGKKTGRNDACPCGSGKKYKKCCGRNE